MKTLQEKQPDTSLLASRQVQVPHCYFRKAKCEYADWRWAMIREFIQNSYDAQAYHRFPADGQRPRTIELSVDDDGVGMDRDTLENVLLCMGGSKKPEGAIGGFGYAKAILFFAHQSYQSGMTRLPAVQPDFALNGSLSIKGMRTPDPKETVGVWNV